MDENGVFILRRAGYTLTDGFWHLSPNHSELVQIQWEILAFMAFNQMEDVLEKYNMKMDQGAAILGRKIGFSDENINVNADFERILENNSNENYEKLGLLSPWLYSSLLKNSETVQNAYKQCIKEDPGNVSKYLEALLEIAKTNSDLEMFALIERSKGIPTFSELKAAFETLEESVDASDEEILLNFKSNFSSIESRRDALKIIAAGRDSFVLSHFLETGFIITSRSKDVKMGDSSQLLPIGLNNVGNICYLNSILQFFFSFKDVHHVLNLFNLQQDSELSKSEEFTLLLKKLFIQMIISDDQSISPDRKIAEMALAFGEQQDVTECLEAILDMFQTAFQGDSKEMIHSLFFGKIRQTLSYAKDGTIKKSTKDEEFNSLIVDVFDDIYVCLDNYFSQTQVDVDKTIGDRYLTIMELPKCLMIHINRVKFDQETKNAYKSNEFTQFYQTIYLDRYMDSNFDSCIDRKSKMNNLRAELAEKQKLLDTLGKKSKNSAPPLQILENTINLLLKDKESASAQTLAQEIRKTIQKLKDEIVNLQSEILSVQSFIDECFSDMKNLEYRLHAVFIHEGDAGYGHYWLYLWNEEERQWMKYNDSVVSRVSESIVFQDTSGKNMNVYALGYVKVGTNISILNRTEANRSFYQIQK